MTRRPFGLPVVAALFVLLYLFAPLTLCALLGMDESWQYFGVATASSAMSIPILFRRRIPPALHPYLGPIAWTFAGLLFLLFPISVLAGAAAFLLPGDGRLIAMAGGTGWMLLGLLGVMRGFQLRVETIALPAANGTSGKTLIQISDVHLGSRRPAFLSRIVRKINALKPDAVLITGDLIDSRVWGERGLASLGQIRAPVCFTLGNHERYEGAALKDVLEWIAGVDITILRQQEMDLPPFQIVGVDDSSRVGALREGLANIEPRGDRYRIVMFHRPKGELDAAAWGAHLMLSGHTHRGQVAPFQLIVRRFFGRLYGLFEVGGMYLYVSCGTGTWGPVLRVGSRNEITRFVFASKGKISECQGEIKCF